MRTHTVTKHYQKVTLASGVEVELELPVKPDSIMEYKEYLIYEKGPKLLCSYLAHDEDAENPLDNDGSGKVYTVQPHGGTHREMQKALGRDTDWGPDLELVNDDLIVAEAIKEVTSNADMLEIMVEHCDDNWPRFDGESDIAFVTRCLDHPDEFYELLNLDTIKRKLWDKGREEGTIGNKYAQSLDVYEHGLVQYSLSGKGPQCRWDTSSGGALWVPDKEAGEEIKSRGPVYQKGKIITLMLRGKNLYCIRTYEAFGEFDKIIYPTFEHWFEAYKYLEDLESVTYLQPLADAEDDAAREIAKSAAEQYTDWCNGNCFCIVKAEYEVLHDAEDGMILDASDEYDCCGGYVGADDAYDTLKEEFDSWKQSL
jgi:hypothetical protein